mmetsp:Transcript_107479/g.334043  ORF Transcript_107479/g.334043 Transcript_107479/m.334043 type:complete len:260 (-) Transcript_107479:176-955(-)
MVGGLAVPWHMLANVMKLKQKRAKKRYGSALSTFLKSIPPPPVNCSCCQQTTRVLPATTSTKLRASAAAATPNSVPAATCQMGPSSSVRRFRTFCASCCTSWPRAPASSSRSRATVRSTSEPASTTVGCSTRSVAPASPLGASGLLASAPSGAVSLPVLAPAAAASAPWATSSAAAGPAAEAGSSMPGDFQITTISSLTRHTPIVWSRFLHAKPSCLPTRTCQCGLKLWSSEAFRDSASSPQRAAVVRFLASSFFTRRS